MLKPALILSLLTVLGLVWLEPPNCSAGETDELPLTVSPSLICDRCTILNAMSADAVFSRGYGAERARWLPVLTRTASLAADLAQCQGHGIPLAYLMSSSAEQLALFRHNPRAWRMNALAHLTEPAYKPELDFATAHRQELLRIFDALDAHGFDDWWKKHLLPGLAEDALNIQSRLRQKINAAALAIVDDFISCSAHGLGLRNLPPLYVAYFSGPYNFNLSRRQVCFRHDLDPDEAAPALLHEWLHLFNPSARVQSLRRQIAASDPFYALACRRLFGAGKEGKEEEFVVAAELYTSIQCGLRSRKTALRYVRNTHGGMPLAGLLLDRLLSAYPHGLPGSFNYNEFLEQALAAAPAFHSGAMHKQFSRLVEPVSGMAGMTLAPGEHGPVVTAVWPSMPASEAGIRQGDVVSAVDDEPVSGRSIAEVIDMISGRRGESFDLVLRRGEQSIHARLTLR